ncbi:hypothetical protein CEXT_238181 [Caerostris extrusa]|uniref:Uncharacterized protein n=1 Tax=Caerostris extrusa TaxID=172846 RepID=A0AAV4T4V3_CAEEX|nr:hypothetical protein CEXT_238181 [Caerostris extrusa]
MVLIKRDRGPQKGSHPSTTGTADSCDPLGFLGHGTRNTHFSAPGSESCLKEKSTVRYLGANDRIVYAQGELTRTGS